MHPIPAVSAVIVSDGRILLVKRGREPNMGLWSLPGGSIEPGETAREAVAREVLEETSLVVDVGDLAAVRDVIARDGDELRYHYVIVSFHATVVSGAPRASSDAADVAWVPLADLESYPTTPGLREHLTAIGLI